MAAGLKLGMGSYSRLLEDKAKTDSQGKCS